MKTTEFNKNYSINRKARSVKGVAKTAGGFAEALTGDGLPYNPEDKYFFFDESTEKVRQSISLRRVDDEWLGSFGLRIVKIENLRADNRDAISDGQNFFRGRIKVCEEIIKNLEAEKISQNQK